MDPKTGWSNYHALQTAFTKRFSNRWQASLTYTLSGLWNGDPLPLSGLRMLLQGVFFGGRAMHKGSKIAVFISALAFAATSFAQNAPQAPKAPEGASNGAAAGQSTNAGGASAGAATSTAAGTSGGVGFGVAAAATAAAAAIAAAASGHGNSNSSTSHFTPK